MAENKELKNNDFQNNLLHYASIGLMAASAVTGSRALLFGAGRARNAFVASMNNFLDGFYGKGVGQVKKLALGAQEGVKGTARLIGQGLSPSESFAFRRTGISRVTKDIYDQARFVRKTSLERFKNGDMTFLQARNAIKTAEKKVHEKLTNDFRNTMMYTGKMPYKNLNNYIGRKGGTAKGKLVEMKSRKQVLDEGIHSNEELFLLGQGWTKRPLLYNNFAIYKDIPASDVLRGIHYHRPAYKGLIEIEDIGRRTGWGNLTKEQVRKVFNMRGMQVMESKEGLNIIMSPSMKARYDWGGYKGIIQWSKKDPKNIKLLASDRPDLLGISAESKGINTLNISRSRKISIPRAKKDLERIINEKDLDIQSTPIKDPYSEARNYVKKKDALVENGFEIPTNILNASEKEQLKYLVKYNPFTKTEQINRTRIFKEYDEIVKNPKRFKGYESYRNYFNKNRLNIATAGVGGLAGAGLLGYAMSDEE